MFRQTREFPVFGKLSRESGQMNWWSGQISLAGFDGPFGIIVRAKANGQADRTPSPAQIAAMARLVAQSETIKALATGPMAEIIATSALVDPAARRDPELVWSDLTPETIEVSDLSYYNDGRIAAILIFRSNAEPDFAPAIETADGRFVEALGGT